MNTEQIEAQRAKFEAQYKKRVDFGRNDSGSYYIGFLEYDWQMWLASATASEGRIAELTEALRDVPKLAEDNLPTEECDACTNAHEVLNRAALAGSATPSTAVAKKAGALSEEQIMALYHASEPKDRDPFSGVSHEWVHAFARAIESHIARPFAVELKPFAYCITNEEGREYNTVDEFSGGRSNGIELYTAAQVQALLDEKRVAPVPQDTLKNADSIPFPSELTPAIKEVLKEIAPKWNAESVYACLIAAALPDEVPAVKEPK